MMHEAVHARECESTTVISAAERCAVMRQHERCHRLSQRASWPCMLCLKQVRLISISMVVQGCAQDEPKAVPAISRRKEVGVDQGGVDTHGREVLAVLAATLALASASTGTASDRSLWSVN